MKHPQDCSLLRTLANPELQSGGLSTLAHGDSPAAEAESSLSTCEQEAMRSCRQPEQSLAAAGEWAGAGSELKTHQEAIGTVGQHADGWAKLLGMGDRQAAGLRGILEIEMAGVVMANWSKRTKSRVQSWSD